MPVLPNKDLEQIQFFEDHLPVWSLTPAAIGLSVAQCTLLASLTKAAREGFNSAQKAPRKVVQISAAPTLR